MPNTDRIVAYEVHVLIAGKWEIHAGYSAEQKRIAVRDAKSLDKISTIGGSKVIREVYDEKNATSRDEVVFLSPKAGGNEKPAAPPKRTPPPGGIGAVSLDSDDGPEAKKQKGAKKVMAPVEMDPGSVGIRVFIRLLLITLVSIVIAGMIAMVSGVIFKESQYFVKVLGNSRPNVLFGIFIATFLLSALPLALKFLTTDGAVGPRKRLKAPLVEEEKKVEPTPVFPEDRPVTEDDFHLPKVDAKLVVGMADRLGRVLKHDLNLMVGDYLPNTPSLHDLLPKEAKEPARKAMNFLRAGLADEKLKSVAMDNVTRFGISLFMAGAIDGMARQHGMDQKAVTRALSYMVQSLGFRKGQADSFARKCDQYLLADARYMQMYLDGRSGMIDVLDSDANPAEILEKSIADWNKPKPRAEEKEQHPTVAVMFTDIVGSTQLTHDKGDRGAMEVVYAHNDIVREAIKLHKGKEIKHLGDGIMASFPVTSSSVEAAVYIQIEIRKYIEKNPEVPLEVKIGIDAGEPIAEDDDLFGTTVQMAARIVDKASTGEIFVSDTVRGMCSGKAFRFDELGRYDLKGINGGTTLFEVVWNDNLKKMEPAGDLEEKPDRPVQEKITPAKVEATTAKKEDLTEDPSSENPAITAGQQLKLDAVAVEKTDSNKG